MSAPTQQRLTADPAVMGMWLTHLYSGQPGFISVCSDGDGFKGERFATDEEGIKAAVAYAVRLDQRRRPKGIYTQVTTLRECPEEGRGGKEHAHVVTHLWADGDFGTIGHKPGLDDLDAPPDEDAAQKVVEESGLPAPSGWTHSGGGWNPVWMLAEPRTIADAEDCGRVEEVTTAWQAILAAQAYRLGWSWDVGIGNVDRLMKLPGTINRKEGLERPTSVGPGSGVLYDFDALAAVANQLLPAARETLAQADREKKQREADRLGRKILPPRPPRAAGSYQHTGEGPLDVIADTMTFADVLLPHGWTFQGHRSDGREAWLRPAAGGDSPSSDFSLLCNDHVAINWSERSGLPVGAQPPGGKLTIGKVYAHLNYGGNTSEAATDIKRAAGGHQAGPAVQLPQQVLAEVKRRCLTEAPPFTGFEGLIAPEEEPLSDDLPPSQDYAQVPAAEAPAERTPIPRTWQAQDLEDVLNGTYQAPRPTVGHRDDGVGLFYPGRVNTIICETEGGKTWFAMAASIQEMNAGNHVLYVDFEDDRGGTVSRLLLLGALPDTIRTYFHYVRPENRPTPADIADLVQVLLLKPTLAVIDGVTEAMSLYGQEINDNNGAALFGRELLRPIKNSGAAVVTLDHVVKSNEGRGQGRYAIGAVHKLNGLDGVQYTMENIQPFGIGLVGRTRVRISKDRPGQIRRNSVPGDRSQLRWFMDLVLTSHDETFAEINLYPPIQHADDPEQDETERERDAKEEAQIVAAEPKVLAVLAEASEPVSKNAIEELVPGRKSTTRRALTRLIHSGRVEATTGPRNAVMCSLPAAEEEEAA